MTVRFYFHRSKAFGMSDGRKKQYFMSLKAILSADRTCGQDTKIANRKRHWQFQRTKCVGGQRVGFASHLLRLMQTVYRIPSSSPHAHLCSYMKANCFVIEFGFCNFSKFSCRPFVQFLFRGRGSLSLVLSRMHIQSNQ